MSKKNRLKTIANYKKVGVLFIILSIIPWIIVSILPLSEEVMQESSIGLIFLGISFVSFFLGIGFFAQARNIKAATCLKCGARIAYEDVEYEELEQVNTGDNVKSNIEFTIYCPECGEERTFTEKFTVAYFDKDGNLHRNNIESQIRKRYSK